MTMRKTIIFVSALLLDITILAQGYEFDGESQQSGRCERITVSVCEAMPYNNTRMPNSLNHVTQHQVESLIAEFKPLIEINCSPDVKFFLCSVFTPMCSEAVDQPISACRPLCERIKNSCSPIMANFGLPWPDFLNCTNFKEREQLCMEPTRVDDDNSLTSSSANKEPPKQHTEYRGSHTPSDKGRGVDSFNQRPAVNCDADYIPLEHTGPKPLACAPSCHADLMFLRKDKQFAEVWITVWSSLCFAVTAFTVLTFWLDTSRFRYPERPIIFLAMCYTIFALGHIVRLILGGENVSCTVDANHQCRYLIYGGLESSECVIVFLLLYYFSMASAIWWVVLTVTWFLAAACKWSHEAIEGLSSLFHLAAWAIPAVQSIAVLITKKVDGDELTGLCFVGNNDPSALVAFLIAPLAVYLSLGCVLMILGFCSLVSIRNAMRRERQQSSLNINTSKFEKLIVRIGIFSVLYFLAASCLIGCYVYAKVTLDRWVPSRQACEKPSVSSSNSGFSEDTKLAPLVEVYMLKLFMSLVIGITSGMWVISSKTVHIWQQFLCCRILPYMVVKQTDSGHAAAFSAAVFVAPMVDNATMLAPPPMSSRGSKSFGSASSKHSSMLMDSAPSRKTVEKPRYV